MERIYLLANGEEITINSHEAEEPQDRVVRIMIGDDTIDIPEALLRTMDKEQLHVYIREATGKNIVLEFPKKQFEVPGGLVPLEYKLIPSFPSMGSASYKSFKSGLRSSGKVRSAPYTKPNAGKRNTTKGFGRYKR